MAFTFTWHGRNDLQLSAERDLHSCAHRSWTTADGPAFQTVSAAGYPIISNLFLSWEGMSMSPIKDRKPAEYSKELPKYGLHIG